MGRPHTWQEMSSREKVRYTNPILINIHMDSNSYTKYLSQLISAEEFAKSKQTGIWSTNSGN